MEEPVLFSKRGNKHHERILLVGLLHIRCYIVLRWIQQAKPYLRGMGDKLNRTGLWFSLNAITSFVMHISPVSLRNQIPPFSFWRFRLFPVQHECPKRDRFSKAACFSNFIKRMNREELKSLKRHDLQLKAKALGIKANQSSQLLIEQILTMGTVRRFHLISIL